jgi:signal transduction histidine kinase
MERDLHDGALQRLLGLQLGLIHVREHVVDAGVAAELRQLEQEAGRIGDDLRNLSHAICPATLVERGLIQALKEATAASAYRVTVEGEVARLSAHAEQALYYCILEAVQNALRHAGSWAKVHVVVEPHGEQVWFSVTDDGLGFEDAGVRKGMGLDSMRDRVLLAGGALTVQSRRGHGTHVHGYVTPRLS